MREIRPSGSEGGAGQKPRSYLYRHWTLNEVFPPAGFGATGGMDTADQVQIFADGAWTIYWLYNENDADPDTAHWVNGSLNVDRGNTVLPSGQGIFFNNRTAPGSVLAYGEIRENDFIRPLATGNNLVGGGYPIDQSATGTGSRAMNLATGFFGSRDFKTADSILVWRADNAVTATGYDTYYLLHSVAPMPLANKWVKMGDVSLAPRDAEVIMLGNRAVFVRSKVELPLYTVPSPWVP